MTARRPSALAGLATSLPLVGLLLVLAQAALAPAVAHAQQTRTEFGKNRVQFHDKFDEWLQYESENYITYWYGESRNIGEAAVIIAEANYPDVQALLEHQMSDKIELIVYTDLSDLKQSNIGAEDAFRNEEGRVKVDGNKVFVHFDGDHASLERQIREGTAQVILSSMMFGANLQEIVQNAVLLDIPLWYSEGLVAYVGQPWTPEDDEQLRQYLLARPKDDFEDMIARRPRLAGHSWWRYVAQTYGRGTIGNLLYLTRISRSVDNAIDYVYGLDFDEVAAGWEEYYRDRVGTDVQNRQELPGGESLKNKHRARITAMRLSPDGQRLAYVLNEIGRQEVFVVELATGERERVLKTGYRNAVQATDYRYPQIAWNPNNQELAVVYERKDVLRLARLTPGSGERPLIEPLDPRFQAVYAFDYVNQASMAMSAVVRGITDIYKYFPETRQSTRITDDYYNELDVRRGAVAGMPGYLFVSNRPDSSLERVQLDSVLPTQPMSVWFVADDRQAYPYAIRLSEPGDPSSPVMVDSNRYAFLDDRTGVRNLFTGRVEEYVPYYEQAVYYSDGDVRRLPDDYVPSPEQLAEIDSVRREPAVRLRGVTRGRTDLAFGIDLLTVAPRTDDAVLLQQYHNGLHRYYRFPTLDSLPAGVPENTALGRKMNRGTVGIVDADADGDGVPDYLEASDPDDAAAAPGGASPTPDTSEADGEDLSDGELFQSRFDGKFLRPGAVEADDVTPQTERVFGLDLPLLERPDDVSAGDRPLHAFRPARIRAYQRRFRTDYLNTTFSNEPLFGGLENFTATPEQFQQQPSGLLARLNTKELFEDYQLELGARFATTFDRSEYYGFIDTRKDRIDKRYGLYHSTIRQRLPPPPGSIDELRGKARSIIALTRWTYPFDVFNSLRATATLRFDRFTPQITDANTLTFDTDREQRACLRLEYVFDNTLDYALNVMHGARAKVYAEVAKGFDVELTDGASFGLNEGLLLMAGFDARGYQRVLRHGVLAVRLAAATTFGRERILFYLGSTDGAVASGFNDEIPVAPGEYAYEMAITNLRGFQTNIRNGNSFTVANAELRLPLLRYAFPHSSSNFIRHFQVVGFGDAGTAWSGVTPFTRDNPINTVTFADDPAYVLTVNYFRDPVVYGFGAGARVNLFGYFLRVDRAWGVETGEVLDPRWHLSLGLDF